MTETTQGSPIVVKTLQGRQVHKCAFCGHTRHCLQSIQLPNGTNLYFCKVCLDRMAKEDERIRRLRSG